MRILIKNQNTPEHQLGLREGEAQEGDKNEAAMAQSRKAGVPLGQTEGLYQTHAELKGDTGREGGSPSGCLTTQGRG